MLHIVINTVNLLLILLFPKNSLKKFQILLFQIKKPFSKGQRAGMSWLPRQNDFRKFCMREETEKVYQRLEEIIVIQ